MCFGVLGGAGVLGGSSRDSPLFLRALYTPLKGIYRVLIPPFHTKNQPLNPKPYTLTV